MYHNLCLEQKYENLKKKSTENCHFYSREKSLYVAWACFRNVSGHCLPFTFLRLFRQDTSTTTEVLSQMF